MSKKQMYQTFLRLKLDYENYGQIFREKRLLVFWKTVRPLNFKVLLKTS